MCCDNKHRVTKHTQGVLLWNPPEYSRTRYIRRILESRYCVETISFHHRHLIERIPKFRQLVLAKDLLNAWVTHGRRLIVIAFSPVPSSIVGILVSKILGLPLLYDLYYSWVESNIDAGRWKSKGLKTMIGRVLEGFCLRSSKLVLVDTRSSQRYSSKLYLLDSSRIVPIYGVVDLGKFTPTTDRGGELRRKLGVQDRLVIMYHGSFQKVHGLETLIRISPQIISQVPKAVFLLVGDGPCRKDCEKIVDRLGLKDRFIFTGRVEHDNIPHYIEVADIWIGLLTKSEKAHRTARFGMFEAMAMGKAVITSKSYETENLITDRENGLLVDPDNPLEVVEAISKLAQENGMNSYIGQNARRLVEAEYNLETMRTLLLEVVTRIEKSQQKNFA